MGDGCGNSLGCTTGYVKGTESVYLDMWIADGAVLLCRYSLFVGDSAEEYEHTGYIVSHLEHNRYFDMRSESGPCVPQANLRAHLWKSFFVAPFREAPIQGPVHDDRNWVLVFVLLRTSSSMACGDQLALLPLAARALHLPPPFRGSEAQLKTISIYENATLDCLQDNAPSCRREQDAIGSR